MCCTVCGHEMRKNQYDLERHWESHHKDLLEKEMKPSWKVPARGASLEKRGFVVKKATGTMVEKADDFCFVTILTNQVCGEKSFIYRIYRIL